MVDRPDWLSFRRFAAFTTALTLSLITLGVYTSATGSGLACQAQWPLCSDQLVPALTINPDFIEWFHRFVAMIAGFFIAATALWSWKAGGVRARLAATLAVVLLPLQISIGAVTVTINGLVPWGYQAPTHAAHLLVALTIFSLLVVTTLDGYHNHHRRPPGRRSQLAFGVAVGALLASGLFSRAVPLLSYSPGAQAWYYTLSLVAVVSLLAAVYWADSADRFGQVFAGGALGLVFVTMLLGRDLVMYTAAIQELHLLLYLAAIALSGVGLWRQFTAGQADRVQLPHRQHE